MNYVDAEIITATLNEKGGKPTVDYTKTDLVIVITCGVRTSAEERIVSWTKKLRKKNANAVIVLTGCLSHRKDIEEHLAEAVAWFIPIKNWTSGIEKVITLSFRPKPSYARRSGGIPFKNFERDTSTPLRSAQDDNGVFTISEDFYQILPQRTSTFQAYVPIMTGCNNFCSYCVVPYARGREKSRAPESIIEEAKKLVRNDYKELYLLGQNVNSYQGIDSKGEKWNFSRLLRAINEIQGNFWIRFISSHPKDITEEMIRTYAECQKVSPNLHLPVQSGSNKVLRLMNRKYTREKYLNTIAMVRKILPPVVLSTDIIVGFPGETEKDFRDSLDIVKKVGYEMLFSLKYSPRPEAAAYKLKDSVSAQEKIERQRRLDQTWKAIAQKKNQRFLGQEILILVDRVKIKKDKSGKITYYAQGKSFDNKDVMGKISEKEIEGLVGKWAVVKVKEVTPLALKGKLATIKKGL